MLRRPGRKWISPLVLIALWASCVSSSLADTVRLRLVWGGGQGRIWQGHVVVEGTTIQGFVPLGVQADEPGSLWQEGNRLVLRSRSPRVYDGVDLVVSWHPEAQLRLILHPAGEPQPEKAQVVPLSRLIERPWESPLDEQGNHLVVRRLGGDRLWLQGPLPGQIVAPGTPMQMALAWNVWQPPEGARGQLLLRLRRGRDGEVLREQPLELNDVPAQQTQPWFWRWEAPAAEGVYTLELELVLRRWPWNLGPQRRTLLARRQFVVLDGKRPLPPLSRSQWQEVALLDAANPRWWQRWKRLRWPLAGTTGQDAEPHPERTPWGEVVRLPRGQGPVGWTSYQLPIGEVGQPHLLEVQVPRHLSQTLAVSILEPDASGQVPPIGVDSGVESHLLWTRPQPGWTTHRVLFWPRSNMPLVVLAHTDETPATFGKLRLLRLAPKPEKDNNPAPAGSSLAAEADGRRRVLALMNRPLFPENFSATGGVDPFSGRSLDDWLTFYQGGTRLVQYLQWAGYSGLVLSVYSDGGTIYPSRLLQPTPRYDTGVYFDTGQGWPQKDVLELLFQLFDRQGLVLVPSVDFSSPLPELERQIRRSENKAPYRWVNPQGELWTEHYPPQRGRAPYYNLLHPQVQQAMLRVVAELVERYGHHRSFGGVAISLSPESYAVLPSTPWGMDPATVERFLQETGRQLPQPGLSARTLPYWVLRSWGPAWHRWRQEQVSRFYAQAAALVYRKRPQARLYLLLGDVLLRPDLQPLLQPQLGQSPPQQRLWEQLGLDLPRLQQHGVRVVLSHLRRAGHRWQQGRLQLAVHEVLREAIRQLKPPALGFYHLPEEIPIQSPPGQTPFPGGITWLVSQIVPLQEQNRRRFATMLAQGEYEEIIDGGWMLLLGQEEALRPWLTAFQTLPAQRFQTLAGSGQPVVVRWANHRDASLVYVVNPTPWPLRVRLTFTAPPRCQAWLLPERTPLPVQSLPDAQQELEVELPGYGLQAIRFSAPGVVVRRAMVPLDSRIVQTLVQTADSLLARLGQLRQPPQPLPLPEASFEPTNKTDAPTLRTWTLSAQPGGSAQVDAQFHRNGQHSLRLESSSGVVSALSQPFAASGSGRLAVTAWLRTDSPQKQPAFRLAIQGTYFGQPYYRYAAIGAPPSTVKLTAGWTQYVFLVTDLPLQGLTDLRVRLDLMGPGRVWVDDVAVYDLLFNQREMVQLSKEISEAKVLLERKQWADALFRLQGYWSQLLLHRVPPPQTAVAARPKRPPSDKGAAEPSAAENKQEQSFWQRWLPRWLRWDQ